MDLHKGRVANNDIYIRDRDLCASLEHQNYLVHPRKPYFWRQKCDEICSKFQNNIGFMGVPGPQPLQKIGQRGGMTAKNDSSLRWVIRYPLFFGWLELVLRRLRRPECPAGPVLVTLTWYCTSTTSKLQNVDEQTKLIFTKKSTNLEKQN